jgi:hypothetical protein
LGMNRLQLATSRSPIPINKMLMCFILIAPPKAISCTLFGQVTRHLHLSASIILQKRVMFNLGTKKTKATKAIRAFRGLLRSLRLKP